ncbi:MAG: alkaline phosphatase family protein, partial [Myxococcota bacterium]|nr:alkaline phosphatase family protein [Myxococcota bacterium]
MTETAAIHAEGPQGLSASRALAHALFAALVVAHTQPLFVTAAAVIPDFGQDFAVSVPLLAAGWVHDFVWLGTLGSLLAFAASRAGAEPETLRALLLALLVAVLTGPGLSAQLDLGALATWALVLGVGSAAFAAYGVALRPSALGFTLAVIFLSLGCGYSNALPTDVATTLFNHLGALTLAWAVLWATRSLRAPMPLFAVIVVLALGAIAESNWLRALSLGSPPPRGEGDASTNAKPVSNAPNLILIVLDTFRADAFDAAADGNTPNLAAFASEARIAHRARSTSSWTLPAHASLFTGSYPTTHGAHFLPRGTSEREAGILADANTTFAELLQARGYETWGIVANHAYLHADTNIDQGFQIWDDR